MKFVQRFALVALVIVPAVSCQADTTGRSNAGDIAIMAYFVPPEEDFRPDELPLDQLTHLIFSFTEVIGNEMKFPNESSSGKLRRLAEQKVEHPGLKVMIACGGWGGSVGFSHMAAEPGSRRKFVKSVMVFLEEYDLDGVDLDWEYPGLPGAGNPHRAEDRENFTLLMKELREAMDSTGKEYVLTFASAGWERYYDHIETVEVMKYADYMNVMTYDFISGSAPYTGHHTNLGWIRPQDVEHSHAYQLRKEQGHSDSPHSTEKIVDYIIQLGVDPAQLVIGAAFYGRGWQGVPPVGNGLYQQGRQWKPWSSYAEIRSDFESDEKFTRYWDPVARAPYLYNPEDSLFISYDDPESVALKTKYVREQGLGGIMFWQLGLDTKKEGSLLDAIVAESE